MSQAAEARRADPVAATLNFVSSPDQLPVALVEEPGLGPDRHTITTTDHEVLIRDARPIAADLDLDRQGFVFMRCPTAVEDFYDDAEVRRVYYPEMERLVAEAAGASKVIVFDHTIRVDDPEAQTERKVRAPVANVHNDFTVRSAPQRVRDLLPADEAERRLAGRYGSMNVWRPIRGPVETAPLVICGYGTIADGDLIAAERHYGDRIGGIYQLAYNPRQRWYYFPAMEREEVVLLKCFDSLTDGTARWTAHGSFRHPDTPAGAAPRESIEVRTLYFFD